MNYPIFLSYLSAIECVLSNKTNLNVVSAELMWIIPPHFCKNHLHLKINDIEYITPDISENDYPPSYSSFIAETPIPLG